MFRIKELGDVFVDACVRDQAGQLMFLSCYGRDGALHPSLTPPTDMPRKTFDETRHWVTLAKSPCTWCLAHVQEGWGVLYSK